MVKYIEKNLSAKNFKISRMSRFSSIDFLLSEMNTGLALLVFGKEKVIRKFRKVHTITYPATGYIVKLKFLMTIGSKKKLEG